MSKELYIGVDVSKNWLDLACYDGISVDWKQGHIRVDNKPSGYHQITRWLKKQERIRIMFCFVWNIRDYMVRTSVYGLKKKV